MSRRILFISLAVLILFPVLAKASEKYFIDPQGNLRMENEYIAIFVNQGRENLGRFALDVTGGNPLSTGDDNKSLVYGHPEPWTSYTTIRINDKDYIFGGPTNKRAGLGENYGRVLMAPQIVEGNKIVTKVAFNDLEVTQELSFMESITTGFPDTARIKYIVANTSKQTASVGVRVMIDTMLGANDGAPFRVFNEAVTRDTVLLGSEIPEFWQTFDSLSNPLVTAQGGLKGEGLTPPDKVYFTNWGSLADRAWDFNFRSGKEFIREGEFELDSAIALFWNPEILKAGETRTYVTSYGLGGITIVPGLLALGLTSPAKVAFDQIRTSFPVVAYVENTSKFTAKDVTVSLKLPAGFKTLNSTPIIRNIGDLAAGDCMQIAWQVLPVSIEALPKSITYEVNIEASNTDGNLARRNVDFASPPTIDVKLSGPKELELRGHLCYPNPFDVVGTLKNTGGTPSYDTIARLVLPPGMSPAYNDLLEIYLGTLQPNENVVIKWRVETHGIQGDVPYGLEVYSMNTPVTSALRNMLIPASEKNIYMVKGKDEIAVGDFFSINLVLGNVPNFASFKLDINYPKEALDATFVSRGNIFLQNEDYLPFTLPVINKEEGSIIGFKGQILSNNISSGILASMHFFALKEGPVQLEITNVEVFDKNGQLVNILPEDLIFSIE